MNIIKKISVIIPTYNRKKILKYVIQSLAYQDYPQNLFEIIIADDGSDDGTQELIEELINKLGKDKIRYCHQEHIGFRAGQARNLGAENAKGNILIFIDSDIIVSKKFITNHVNEQKNSDIVLGYTAAYGNQKQYKSKIISETIINNDLENLEIIEDFRNELFSDTNISSNKLWKVFVSNNFSIKKELFLKNKFDEDFVGWGSEDEELGYRLYKNNLIIKTSKKCLGYHFPHSHEKNEGIYNTEKVKSLTNNMILFYQKHKINEVKNHIINRFKNIPDKFKNKKSSDLFFKSIN